MLEFDKDFVKNVSVIREASEGGRLVLFVGAGVSKNSGIPDWNTLTEELSKDLEIGNEQNPLKIAQMYYNERKNNEYLDKVQSVLNLESASINPIHKILLELKPNHILTTNYDCLLEQAAKEYHYPFSVVENDSSLAQAKHGSYIVKVHGDFTDGGNNIVLKEDDYLNYEKNYPLIKSFLESLFASKVVLFIGYGYNDDNLKLILNHVRSVLGSNSPRSYLIKTSNNVSKNEINYYKNKGINTLLYDEKIDEYLSGNNPFNFDFNANKNNGGLDSEDGIKLYKMINFILSFDHRVYKVWDTNIIDKALGMLTPISDQLELIPPFHIQNIFPFNTSKISWKKGDNYNYLEENFSLNTKDKDLIKLFNAVITDKNALFVRLSKKYFDSLIPKNHKEDRVIIEKHYNKKALNLFQNLNKNLLAHFPVKIREDGSVAEWKRIWSFQESEYVDEPLNNFFRGNFGSAFDNLVKEQGLQRDHKFHLERGYLFYQFKNYDHACIEFRKSAIIAWKEKKHLTYLISCLNISRLLSSTRNSTIKENGEGSQLIEEVASLAGINNLTQIITLFDSSLIEKELFRYILENEIEDSIGNKVRQALFDASLNENQSWNNLRGPEWISSYNLKFLFYYYQNNYIVFDHYSNFTSLIRQGIEVCLMRWSKSSDMEKLFDPFLIEMIVLYLRKDDVIGLFKKYEVEPLKFEHKNLVRILEFFTSVFKSYYSLDWTNRPKEREYDVENSLFGFGSHLDSLIETLLELLPYLHIPKDSFSNELKKSIIQYCRVVKRWHLRINAVLNRYGDEFDKQDLKELLFIFLSLKQNVFLESNIITTVSNLKRRFPDYRIEDKTILKSIDKYLSEHLESITHINPLLNDEYQEKLKKRLSEALTKDFDHQLFRISYAYKIMDVSKYFSLFLHSIIEKTKFKNNHPHIAQYERDLFHECTLAVKILEEKKKGLNDELEKLILKLRESALEFDFLYDPKGFDYSNFKKEWIYIDRSAWFVKRMKGVNGLQEEIKKRIKKDKDEKLSLFLVDKLT